MTINKPVPLYKKWGLTVEEGAAYYGIGENALRRFIKEHPNDDFFLMVGNKTLIKRVKFEELLNGLTAI